MKDLTKGSTSKAIISFMGPVFAGSLFQLFYSLVDTRIVGSTLGNDALAAVGATTTLNTLIVGFLIGLTNGFAIVAAQKFGANDKENVRKTVACGLELGIIVSIIVTFLSVLLLPQILRILNMPDEHFQNGYNYIVVILMGMSFSMLYNICASMLRAIGDTITPLCFLVFSCILNIFLDYWFITGLNMNVKGAAFATIVSQAVAFVLCVIYMLKRYPFLRIKFSDLKMDISLAKKMLSQGLSMGFMQSLVSLGTVSLQSAINTFGTNTIVAHSAARKITEIFMMPFGVMGMTMATYCGQNRGANEIARIKKGIKEALFMVWGWCVIVLIASYTLSPILVKAVTATTIQEVIDTATLYLKVDTLLYFVTAVISVLRNSLQGIGDPITPVISSMIELVGKILVVIFLTPRIGYWGIIVAEPIVWVLMVIPLIVRTLTIDGLKEKKD